MFVTCMCQERATIGRPPLRHTRNVHSHVITSASSQSSERQPHPDMRNPVLVELVRHRPEALSLVEAPRVHLRLEVYPLRAARADLSYRLAKQLPAESLAAPHRQDSSDLIHLRLSGASEKSQVRRDLPAVCQVHMDALTVEAVYILIRASLPGGENLRPDAQNLVQLFLRQLREALYHKLITRNYTSSASSRRRTR